MISRAYFHLIDQFNSARSIEDIHSACSAVCEQYGFDSFLYGAQIPVSLVKPQKFIISGYPTAWLGRYKQLDYIRIDPAVAHCMRRSVPLDWRTLEPLEEAEPAVRRFMGEARAFGLNSGLSIPVHGGQGESAMLSLACADSSERTLGRLRQALPFVQSLAAHVHEATRRIIEIKEIAPAKPTLTRREKECLLWAAEGKTSWETAQILGVAERTVIFHLQNAAGKLNVSSRQHAVARALSLGLIAPTPA